MRQLLELTTSVSDLVLDPFCGSGSMLIAAQQTGRRWIGIDNSLAAIDVTERRLMDMAPEPAPYSLRGVPGREREVRDLAASSVGEFEAWVLRLLGARPQPGRGPKGSRSDGELDFADQPGMTRQVAIEVKARQGTVSDVAQVGAHLDRGLAEIGVLVAPDVTRGAVVAANRAGFFIAAHGEEYPRIQILTIADLIAGGRVRMPRTDIGSAKG
jgi:hypothetical protein